MAVHVEMPSARKMPSPDHYLLPRLMLTPEEREEELLDRAGPLCGSDLSLSFPSLDSLSPVLQRSGPNATSGNQEWSWALP